MAEETPDNVIDVDASVDPSVQREDIRTAILETSYPRTFTLSARARDGLEYSTNTTSTGSFTVSLKTPLVAPEGYEWAVALQGASIPYSFWQWSTTTPLAYERSYLPVIKNGSTVIGMFMWPGSYANLTELCQGLQQALQLYVDPSFTVAPWSVYPNTGIIRFEKNDANTYFILGDTYGWKYLGINMGDLFFGVGSDSQYSTNPPDIFPTQSIRIAASFLEANSYQTATGGNTQELQTMYLDFNSTPFGSNFVLNNTVTDNVAIGSRVIDTVKFSLIDEYGEELDMNGGSWNITVKFTLAPMPRNRLPKVKGRSEVTAGIKRRLESRIDSQFQTEQQTQKRQIILNSILTRLQAPGRLPGSMPVQNKSE